MQPAALLLESKVALITGATQGIGRGMAGVFMGAGAHVIINGLEIDAVDGTVAALQEQFPGRVVYGVAADVSEVADVEGMFRTIDDRFGRIDILVNNAGIVWKSRHFLEFADFDWARILAVNLGGTILCSLNAAKRMASKRSGAIVNLSSVGAARAHRDSVAYDASKGGIEAATRAMAVDLADWNIRVNALGPGAVRTEYWDSWSEDQRRAHVASIPLGHEASPEDIGAAAAFLCSDGARNITGQVLYVDGGLLAKLRP